MWCKISFNIMCACAPPPPPFFSPSDPPLDCCTCHLWSSDRQLNRSLFIAVILCHRYAVTSQALLSDLQQSQQLLEPVGRICDLLDAKPTIEAKNSSPPIVLNS
eukprot:COSAG06_NODE_51872_length_309_cov_0.971429_1_plen_103_part_11